MQKKETDRKQEKKELRREIRSLRKAHTDEEIHAMSLSVKERLLALPEYQKARILYAYMDCKHEVETRDVIRAAWAAGKRVAVPKVLWKKLQETERLSLLAESYTVFPVQTSRRCSWHFRSVRQPSGPTVSD